MRIIRVEHGGTSYYGILEDGLVFRLHQQPGHMEPIPLSEAKVLPLVTPSKVVCVGLNYKAHAEELGYPLPNMPSFFLKPPSSIIGNGEPIVLPSGMGRIEHEAELAMVVGKVCRNLTPEEAEESLFGFTCANDVTAREVQKVDPLIGHCKSYDTFCPIGPWIETELEDINDLFHPLPCKRRSPSIREYRGHDFPSSGFALFPFPRHDADARRRHPYRDAARHFAHSGG